MHFKEEPKPCEINCRTIALKPSDFQTRRRTVLLPDLLHDKSCSLGLFCDRNSPSTRAWQLLPLAGDSICFWSLEGIIEEVQLLARQQRTTRKNGANTQMLDLPGSESSFFSAGDRGVLLPHSGAAGLRRKSGGREL